MRYVDVSAILALDGAVRRKTSGFRLALAADRISLRDLIARAVATELERRRAASVQRSALLLALFGGASMELVAGPAPSEQEETARALRAFEDRRYSVLVNGRRVRNLDEVLSIGVRTRVAFVRLVPLESG